ncbi:hypothetical protein GW17_00019642 [Ensete ventricosum]|nr:hypothetical protein GW17_00019642 [Ensete ventricosum]
MVSLKSTVGSRLRKKKGRGRRRGKEEIPRPCALVARGSLARPRCPRVARERLFSPRGEKDRGDYFYSCFDILDIILDYPCLFAGHLTSKSDVYSFGVVLLEMMTGRRSMDKNRPNGEHNLVEWARPHLGERRRFYRLIDPRLEGNFSVKGAQKVAQLAHSCLSRDSKARPMMSEVVEALKPLVNLKDMASSSYFFQTMQTERAMAHSNSLGARNGSKLQGSFGRNGQQPMRSLSHGAHASSYHQSPKPSGR